MCVGPRSGRRPRRADSPQALVGLLVGLLVMPGLGGYLAGVRAPPRAPSGGADRCTQKDDPKVKEMGARILNSVIWTFIFLIISIPLMSIGVGVIGYFICLMCVPPTAPDSHRRHSPAAVFVSGAAAPHRRDTHRPTELDVPQDPRHHRPDQHCASLSRLAGGRAPHTRTRARSTRTRSRRSEPRRIRSPIE